MSKPKVAFICVHNACRSQMAEALSRLYAVDAYDAYSAGTETKPHINPDAVAVVNKLYGVDMNAEQRPKLIDKLPPVDIVITMGCGVSCPYLPSKYREDWGVDDPAGKDEQAFIDTAKTIEKKVRGLKSRIGDIMGGINKIAIVVTVRR